MRYMYYTNEDLDLCYPKIIPKIHNDLMVEMNSKVNIRERDNAVELLRIAVTEQINDNIGHIFRRDILRRFTDNE